MTVSRTIRVLFCALLWLCIGIANAATVSGFEIINKAFLTYIDTFTGERVEVESNTSRIHVAELYQFSLNIDQELEAARSEALVLAHTLTNTGNALDEYSLELTNVAGDQGDLDNLQLLIDLDGNGQVDADDPVAGSSVILRPGASIALLVSGNMPTTIAPGGFVDVLLSANSAQSATSTLSNTDRIRVLEPAQLHMSLTQTPECSTLLSVDDVISYQLDINNATDQLPVERQVLVDGVLKTGVLVQLSVPEGLSLWGSDAVNTHGFESLAIVQQRSTTDDSWISHAQGDTNVELQAFAVLYPSHLFTPGALVPLQFSYAVQSDTADQWQARRFEVAASIDIDDDQQVDFVSNTVCNQAIQLGASNPAVLRFVTSGSETNTWIDTSLYRLDTGDASSTAYRADRDGVYLELVASISDLLALTSVEGVRHTSVNLQSSTTGDSVVVLMRETQPGSGVYRSVHPVRLNETSSGNGAWCPDSAIDAATGSILSTDNDVSCVLRSATDDKLIAEFTDPINNTALTDAATVNPASRVFDSSTLKPVAGAIVTLYKGSEVAVDPVTGVPLVFTSDEAGRYFIPPLPVDTWLHIGVAAPKDYLFPSRVAAEKLDGYSVSAASYGESGFNAEGGGLFSVSGESLPLIIDIPLDPRDLDAILAVEKRVLDESVEVGEPVRYEVIISNQGESVLSDVIVVDTPAYGFKLIPRTITLDRLTHQEPDRLRLGTDASGQASGDDATQVNKSYLFDIGRLESGQSRTLRYQLQATPAALHGDGVNTVVASARTETGVAVASQSSRATVEVVRTGVLSERAILFGKVYVDSTCDWIQNQSEWPIGGVKLYLQDGSFVVTDEDGQYSLYGMRPGLYVIKVDPLTLPEGLALKPLDNRNAADASSRFVDLSEGDFHRADFATGCPEVDFEGVFNRLEQRNRNLRGSWLIEEAGRFDPDGKSRLVNERQRATADGDLSNGLLSAQRPVGRTEIPPALEADVLPAGNRQTDTPVISSPDATEVTAGMASPTEMASRITAEQAKQGTWLWPETEFSTDGRFMAVVRAGASPQLMVNGVEVSDAQLGERIGNRRERAELVAWYGIQLKPGLNEVKVVGKDNFGNVRTLASGMFKRPAAGVSIRLRTKQDTLPADGGRTMLPIDVVINDANGYPANGVYFVTLDTTAGDFLEPDLQANVPGVQVRIDNGRGKIHIRSSELSGRLQVTARSGNMQTALQLVQVAAARPLLGAGLIELGGRWSSLSAQDDRADLESGFETTTRAAVFLKGRVKKDMKLTLSYDTDKDTNTELLRDLNPNEHYPTFGDASIKGFEAQSRSKLYAKLERDRHSIMWGDYLTDTRSDLDNLARVQRTLTGANAILDTDRHILQMFAARVSDIRASEVVRGNGTAMLFRLDGAPIVANSEVIEREVRDRDNPGLVISSERLLRFTDYTLDSETGLLSFRDVVPSVDENLNPVFIRASYDQRSKLDEYLVTGLRWQYNLTDQWKAGFTFTEDQNPLSGYRISGLHSSAVLGLNTTVSAAVATMSHRDGTDSGAAQRVRLEHFWSGSRNHRTVMSWARADATFTNTDSGLSAGRQEWQLEHKQPLTRHVNATFKSSLSESTTDSTHYGSAGLNLDRRLDQWTVNGGLRRIWSADGTRSLSFNTVLLGATRRLRLPGDRTMTIGLDAERGLSDASRYRYGIDSRVQMFDHVSLYMRYEREQQLSQQSLTGSQQGSRQWILGVESDVLPSTQLYSEYRMRGSYTGRSMETASGVRGRYQLRDGLTLNPSLEVIDVLRSENSEDSIAVSIGVNDSRNPNRKMTAQAELRDTRGSRYYGFRATLAKRLNLDWTTLVREEFTRQSPSIGQVLSRHQFTLGLARRPKLDNQHHALLLANWREEYGPEDGQDRRTYLLSTHQNRQLGKGFTLSGRAGMKWQSTHYESGDVFSRSRLLDMRVSKDINRRWEVDLRGGWLGVGNGGGRRFSLGAGVSWIVDRNIRLGLAYNAIGFSESDLDAQGFNRQGVQLGLQFKFDEDWFQWLSD